ncbi:hypothetical protein GCM10010420_24000 [Streptomyces glaucosporus]|uniref:Uncharacterized protein n=1 Tax=Streptomyces glaucosporus TaxID=284044 RepID=A0ABP5V9K7_9ACTN
MDTSEQNPGDGAPSLPPDWPEPDAPELYWEVPAEFHSLGLEYDDERREAHLSELAVRIWPGGTGEQHDTIASWYREVSSVAAGDEAVYAGIGLFSTDDDRLSIASLVIRCEQVDSADAHVAATALEEFLSNDPAQEVHRTEADCGPVVISFSGNLLSPTGEEEAIGLLPAPSAPVPPLVTAQIDVYCPLPGISRLLVFSLSTPSTADFPWYVHMLSGIVDTVEVVARPLASPDVSGPPYGQPMANPLSQTPGTSPISFFVS